MDNITSLQKAVEEMDIETTEEEEKEEKSRGEVGTSRRKKGKAVARRRREQQFTNVWKKLRKTLKRLLRYSASGRGRREGYRGRGSSYRRDGNAPKIYYLSGCAIYGDIKN
ncbi:uncharacterized protein LOC143266630 [Megachile rotundata]|uniref:uncharacterized protein LOC143266630 n=1 Tax=Megachile rotundata TaxID=143995 RepID=UPI003FD16327